MEEEKQDIRKETIELATLLKQAAGSKAIKNLTEEEVSLIDSLTLNLEIQLNFGDLFPTILNQDSLASSSKIKMIQSLFLPQNSSRV